MKQIQQIRTMLSHPGDIATFWKKLDATISAASRRTSTAHGIGFETISPSRGLRGGVAKGGGGQAVVDRQLADCDLYIGFMWTRAGTPTARYGSGTIEEFETVLKLWKKQQRSRLRGQAIEIRFYFLNSPSQQNQIDTRQVDAVRKFKGRLNKANVFYKDAKSISNLLDDLTDELHALAAKIAGAPTPTRKRPKRQRTSADHMGPRVVRSLLKR
jgi:hypothetical protein